MHKQLTTSHQHQDSKTTAAEFFQELNVLRSKYPMCYIEAWTPDDFDVSLGNIKLTNEKHFHYVVATLAKQGTFAEIISPSNDQWETIANWHAPQHPMSVDCISTSKDLSEDRDRLQPFLFGFEDLADEDVVEDGLEMYRSHLDANNGNVVIGQTE